MPQPFDLNGIDRAMLALNAPAAEGGVPVPRAASDGAPAPTGDELPTPEERAMYKKLLASDKAEAERYRIVRDYLRKCDAVLADPATAGSLPVQPAKLYQRYLNADERERVDSAVDLHLAALRGAGKAPAKGPAMLAPGQLTPAEKQVYDGLSSNPASARKYLVTRDFLRKCDAVLADHSKAIDLPVQPEMLVERYLSAAEKARVDEAVDLNLAALMNEASDEK